MFENSVEKLNKALGGIKNMSGKPDLLFIIDTNKEVLAVKEANKIGIPIEDREKDAAIATGCIGNLSGYDDYVFSNYAKGSEQGVSRNDKTLSNDLNTFSMFELSRRLD